MFVQIIYEKEFNIEKVSHENYFSLFSLAESQSNGIYFCSVCLQKCIKADAVLCQSTFYFGAKLILFLGKKDCMTAFYGVFQGYFGAWQPFCFKEKLQ